MNDCYTMREMRDQLGKTKLSKPANVVPMLRSIFQILDNEREHFIVLSLNTKNYLKSIDIVSIGTLNANIVHPRDVFYAAISHRSASIITTHNHPSGDTSPSDNDLNIVKKITQAGEIIGIDHLDHIIFGGEEWLSLGETNQLGGKS